MPSKYTQSITSSRTRFTQAPMAELEFSTYYENPTHLTTYNAGDIVPIFCEEVLPHETIDMGLDFVTRQATVACPVMGQLVQDIYAFFVPNRVVNKSWKNVMGENTSGSWTAPTVTLAPLCGQAGVNEVVNIPVGSVADYYGFPTQAPIPKRTLEQCHDLKFRGYLEIYNNYFRDQNYQPPIPYSKLNVYNGFLLAPGQEIGLLKGAGTTSAGNDFVLAGTPSDGSFGAGSVVKEFYGDGSTAFEDMSNTHRKTSWSALDKPLKANKMHDYFTSVLPSPQKGREVAVPVTGLAPLTTGDSYTFSGSSTGFEVARLNFLTNIPQGQKRVATFYNDSTSNDTKLTFAASSNIELGSTSSSEIYGANIYSDLGRGSVSVSVTDLRLSSAIQRVYELLGNGGSRYVEFVNSFFGLEVDNPFDDIPTFLGHYRRDLDLFQTAQTSASPASVDGAGTPQGTLTAFGYTNNGGSLFTKTFNEHGYVHMFAVVRHRNVYPHILTRDNFRMSMLDFYSYPLANISEQPVYTREINPFINDGVATAERYVPSVFGYQSAWEEYRMSVDRVSGYMRPGLDLSVSQWNYADNADSSIISANGEFMRSNTADVVVRSTAVQDRELPQFKGQFTFRIKKEMPMPIYSVPGADIF